MPPAALEVRSLVKSFGAVRALRGVSIVLRAGEVLALVGDNGAGKSTLVKCVSGLIHPDEGEIRLDGEAVTIATPQAAREMGIETVHQDLMLVGPMDVAANLFLNREIRRGSGWVRGFGFVHKRRMYTEARRILERLHITIPNVRQAIENLSGGQRQAVAVGRAVAWGRHIVLMDEPAAALGVEQSRLVLDLIRRLADEGVAVLLISHNMQHVIDVADRAIVLRHGHKVGDVRTADVDTRDLVELITGVTRIDAEAEAQVDAEDAADVRVTGDSGDHAG